MILSSKSRISEPAFEGYAWVGADLIVGSDGARKFEKGRLSSIPAGEDGCYVTVQKTASGWEVGTDYRGLARIFLYRSGRNWAVGTSLYELVKYVRNEGWTLTLLDDSVAAYLSTKGFSTQLCSLDAHFEQIYFVPSFAFLKITGPKIEVEYREALPQLDYENALSNFLGTWKARLETLSQYEDGSIKFDLSGGIDSRAVIAFALESGVLLRSNTKTKVVSSTNPSQALDLEVAEEIANKYGFKVNAPTKLAKQRHESEKAINGWKKHSLGVYSPVYLYGTDLTPKLVHAHGAGGGNFRPTYRSVEGKARVLKKIMPDNLFDSWWERIDRDTDMLSEMRPLISRELLHYREFRNRLHFGHRSHESVVFMPLESKLTDQITDRTDDRDGRQIYFDVMESLVPGLMYMKFDKEEKCPTGKNIDDLTIVQPVTLGAGSVYWEDSEENSQQESAGTRAFDIWIEGAAQLISEGSLDEIMPDRFLTAATEAIGKWRGQAVKPRSNGPGMIGLSHAYTIDFLTNSNTEI